MISAGELASLREDFEAWMTEAASVERPSSPRASDGKGGYTNGWYVAWTGTIKRRPASETRSGGTEASVGDATVAASYWNISFPAGTDVQTQDRVICSDRTYQVVGVLDKTTEIQRTVLAVEKV